MEQRYAPDEAVPGTVYRVVREIGQGGMGRVYEVEDTTVGKRYALKILRGAHATSAQEVERLKQESRTMVRVAHPNIVDVITAGVAANGSFFYVMELLAGRSLRKVLRDAVRLDPSAAVPIAIDIADALALAHAEGVVHRDVKPDNIFVVKRHDMTTHAKLLDFGVAAMLDNLRSTLRETGKLLGTPRYASPQQQRGEKAHPSMDIWALGYVLFEMLVGHGPFLGRALTEIVVAVQGPERAFRVSDFVHDVPVRLDTLVAQMLEKELNKRVASMDEVAEEARAVFKIVQAGAAQRRPDESTIETAFGLVNRTSPGDLPPENAPSGQGTPDRNPPSNEAQATVTPPFFADLPGSLARAEGSAPSRPRADPSTVVMAGESAEGELDEEAVDRAWGMVSVEMSGQAARIQPTQTITLSAPPDSSRRFMDVEPTPATPAFAVHSPSTYVVRPAAGAPSAGAFESGASARRGAFDESHSGAVRTPSTERASPAHSRRASALALLLGVMVASGAGVAWILGHAPRHDEASVGARQGFEPRVAPPSTTPAVPKPLENPAIARPPESPEGPLAGAVATKAPLMAEAGTLSSTASAGPPAPASSLRPARTPTPHRATSSAPSSEDDLDRLLNR